MAKAIDPKFLAGLYYRSSEPQKDDAGATRHVPTKRPLEPGDVLDWKDNGPTVTIVTADGKKHLVEKKKAAKDAESAEEPK